MIATTPADALKARARRSLPTLSLEQIRIASPCTASWADMRGDDRSRRCGQCDKVVHDLSAMTRAEAEALVSADGPAPCVRLWVRRDGTVLTQDCPVGLARLRRHLRRLGAAFGALASGLLGLVGCGREVASVPVPFCDREEVVMGRMMAPTPLAAPPATPAAPAPAAPAAVETGSSRG